MATEIRRQTLLREMGVQSWFPRTTLPGAGPSHSFAVTADESVQSAPRIDRLESARLASSRPANAHAASVLTESGDQIPAALKATLASGSAQVPGGTQPAQPKEPTASAPVVAEEPALTFAFSWFNVDRRLAVLAMLPAGADSLNAACRQMLQRILTALSPQWQDAVGHENTFHWPFPGGLGLSTGQHAARQAVDGFVARRLREQPAAMLLVLADDAPAFLYGDTPTGDENINGQLFVHRQFDFAMLRTHSLHAMEANSALKRSAWQAMQSLRDRLNRGAE